MIRSGPVGVPDERKRIMPSPDARRRRVLLIVGGEHHDFDRVRRELLQLVGEDDRLRTTCAQDFRDVETLAAGDFLITYTSNLFPSPAQLTALGAFIETGGRWLAVHASAAVTRFRPPEIEIAGIRLPGLTDTPDLEPEFMDLLGCRFVSHLAPQAFTVAPCSDHPIVAGLAPFEITDEPYILELRAECEILLDARYVGRAPGYVADAFLTDERRPQMLLRRKGAGEILYLAPGHACGRFDLQPFAAEVPAQPGPWPLPAYREIIRRAIRWGTGQPIKRTASQFEPAPELGAAAMLIEEAGIMRIASDIDRAVDLKDWPRMRRHFGDSVLVDIGVVGGKTVVEMPSDVFVGEVAAINPAGKRSYHSHTNTLVTVTGDEAELCCHSYGWNLCTVFDPPVYEVWGAMTYRFRCVAGRWQVTFLRLEKWRESGNPAVSEARGPFPPSGAA